MYKSSLRVLLLGAIFSSTLFMIVPHLLWEYFGTIRVARETMTNLLTSVGHIVTRDVETNLFNGTSVLVDEQVRNAMLIDSMLSVDVLNENDIVLNSSQRSLVGSLHPESTVPESKQMLNKARSTMAAQTHHHSDGNRICAYFPFEISPDGNLMHPTEVGVVVLEMSMASSVAAARDYFIKSSTISLLAAIIASIFAWRWLQITFVADLKKLLHSAGLYGTAGILPESLQLQSLELSAIDDALLRMSRELEHRQIQLKSSEERYRRVFETSTEGLLVAEGTKDLDSYHLIEVNHTLRELLASACTLPIPGSNLTQFLPGEFKHTLEEIITKDDSLNITVRHDIELATATGEKRYLRIWGYLDHLDAALPRLFLRVQDIDADRRRELLQSQVLQLHRASALELERVGQLKDDFLANMSHELRTPLHGILGACDILQEEVFGALTPKQKEMLDISRSSARHLLSIINGILDLAKIQAGKFTMEFVARPASELVEAAYCMTLPLANQKSINLSADCLAPSECKIYVDETRIRQALLNLLSNAVEHTNAEGSIDICSNWNREAHSVSFEVIDTGCGIEFSSFANLFSPFEQVSAGLNRSQNGTGLGLSLVEKLVKMHLGHVNISSTPGRGSTFTIVLPDLELALEITKNQDLSEGGQEPDSSGCKAVDVLILDSFKPRQLHLMSLLSNKGLSLMTCDSVMELPKLLLEFRPPVLFVELDKSSGTVTGLLEANRAGMLEGTRIIGISNFIFNDTSTSLATLYQVDMDLAYVLAQPFSNESLSIALDTGRTAIA